MRMLLFTGKGGAGTTTLAAATAAHTARRGRKTLVLSVDRAHSLADTLGVPLDAEPAEVSIGLYAARVDIRRRLERAWPPLRGLLAELAPLDGELSVSADALAMLPAVEQVLALLQVRDHAASGLWDTVVLDCAPVVDTLRLLALPTTLPWYLGRLLPAHRPGRSSRSLPARLAAVTADTLFDAVGNLRAELAEVDSLLHSPDTSVRLVLTPRAAAVSQARRTFTALALHGYPLDQILVNRVLVNRDVPGSADPWYRSWTQSQRRQLTRIRESFVGVPLRLVPFGPDEPTGMAALLDLADQAYGSDDPLRPADPADRPAHLAESMRVERVAGGFEWVFWLPLAERGQVDLARVDDDLVISLGAHGRVIPLPAVLRRCVTDGARLADGWLRVRFRPDPARWPAALLPAADRGADSNTVGGTGTGGVGEQ